MLSVLLGRFMKETIKDFFGYFKPIFENTQYRFNNPLGYAFAFSWVLFNWKAVYYFFFSDEKASDKIIYLQSMYVSDNGIIYTYLLVLPLLSSVAYIILAPIISNLATMTWSFFDKSFTGIRLWFVENIPFMSRAEQTEMYNIRVKNEAFLRSEIKRRDEMISVLYSNKALNDIADNDTVGKYKPSPFMNEEAEQSAETEQDEKDVQTQPAEPEEDEQVESEQQSQSNDNDISSFKRSDLETFTSYDDDLKRYILPADLHEKISSAKRYSIIKKLNNIFDAKKMNEIFNKWLMQNSSFLVGYSSADKNALHFIWLRLMQGHGATKTLLNKKLNNKAFKTVMASMFNAGFLGVNDDLLYMTDKMVDSIVSATEGFM
jgi:hypothetical protein